MSSMADVLSTNNLALLLLVVVVQHGLLLPKLRLHFKTGQGLEELLLHHSSVQQSSSMSSS